MKKTGLLYIFSFMLLAAVAVSCSKDDNNTSSTNNTPAAKASLYDTLGAFVGGGSYGVAGVGSKASGDGRAYGVVAISAVIDGFLTNVLADNAIKGRFSTANAKALRNNLIDQVTQGTGGPAVYKGLSMKAAHSSASNPGANVSMITEAEFNALVGDLVASMTTLKVPAGVQNSIAKILLPMKSDIVGNP